MQNESAKFSVTVDNDKTLDLEENTFFNTSLIPILNSLPTGFKKFINNIKTLNHYDVIDKFPTIY